MEKISIDLKYCYGIKALKYDFDFSNGKAFIIYAPNGAMKTSLANVFQDLSKEINPRDALFEHRPSLCSILDEAGTRLIPDDIFVVNPYNEVKSNKIVKLLVMRN